VQGHSYFYYALGKNGEPLKNVSVNFSFNHAIHPNHVSSTLFTDTEGKIELGPLEDIYEVSSNFTSAYGACSRSWNIPYLKEMIDYPESIEVLEDEPIEIPVPSDLLSASEISLIKYSENGQTIQNMHNHMELDKKASHGFGTLLITDLEKGQYMLSIRKLNIELNIYVHEGVYWEADGFVLKKNSIIEIKNEPKYLRIGDISVNESEENKDHDGPVSKLKFNLTNTDDSTRAHVFAFTYLPDQPHSEFMNMRQVTRAIYDSTESFPFTKWENVFQSNRKLGDEYNYVFKRKNAKRFIGNTLERPQLIMKRMKVKDTSFVNEVIKDGAVYESIQADRNFAMKKKMGGEARGRRMADPFQNNIERLCCLQNQIYGFQNFLKNAACVIKNLTPDANGNVDVELDVSNYTNVLILATSEKSTTQVIYDIEDPVENTKKRNLTLNEPLDHTKFFNEVRNTDNIYEAETYRIQDITSTEYIFVDSLDKIKKVSDDLLEITGKNVDKDLFFLLKWGSLGEEQKNKKYTEFQCHEMNLFLYFKDNKYFVKVAKPFISSKMEKTFMDYWLLGDFEKILHYQEICHFDKLNALEQTLLVFAVLVVSPEKAKVIAKRIKDASDAVSKISPEQKNRMFDTVLSLNLLQKDTSKMELMQQVKLNKREKDLMHLDDSGEVLMGSTNRIMKKQLRGPPQAMMMMAGKFYSI
jgi:hypothetical protein